jgi:hypothetical protein
MRHLTDLVDRAVPTDAPIGRVVVAAWLVKRVAGRVAAWLVDRSERGRSSRSSG